MAETVKDTNAKKPDERMKRKGKGLGRGLDALFEPDSAQSPAGKNTDQLEVRLIDITDLVPNRAQPRKDFDPDILNELAESIKDQGIFQPLILTADDSG